MAGTGGTVHGIHLSRGDENAAGIDALATLLGDRAGLDGLLPELSQQARPSRLGRLLGRAVDTAYRWEDHDERDPRWWPQGISTTADADDTERVAGRRLVVTTWYSKDRGGGSHGSRVTFLDLETLRYEHVLLVTPRLDADGTPVLAPLVIHAGGVVWRGPYLHVAATARGFVTCHLGDIIRADGRPTAHGHGHVLPVRFAYHAHAAEGHERLRYSFLSLDRSTSPPCLLAGEYGRGSATTRLARFSLTASGLPVTDGDGIARPVDIDDGGVSQMQGAVVARDRHHVSVSHGSRWPGSLHVGRSGGLRERRLALPMGPEDLAYWPSTDRLWSLTEHPRRRWVVSMRRSWFD